MTVAHSVIMDHQEAHPGEFIVVDRDAYVAVWRERGWHLVGLPRECCGGEPDICELCKIDNRYRSLTWGQQLVVRQRLSRGDSIWRALDAGEDIARKGAEGSNENVVRHRPEVIKSMLDAQRRTSAPPPTITELLETWAAEWRMIREAAPDVWERVAAE